MFSSACGFPPPVFPGFEQTQKSQSKTPQKHHLVSHQNSTSQATLCQSLSLPCSLQLCIVTGTSTKWLLWCCSAPTNPLQIYKNTRHKASFQKLSKLNNTEQSLDCSFYTFLCFLCLILWEYKSLPYLFKMRGQVLLSVAPKFIYIYTQVLQKRNTSVTFFSTNALPLFFSCCQLCEGFPY